jgi:osmotically-inducible protein OsmY
MRRLILASVSIVLLSGCAGMKAPTITASRDDETVAAAVRTALLNDPAVHANEISVSVQNGVVTLTGQVHGQQEADAAVATARRTNGVKDVRSELRVRN